MKISLKKNKTKKKVMFNDKVISNEIKKNARRGKRIHIFRTADNTLKNHDGE